MKNKIIAYVDKSDRNIYLTIEDGALVSINYSQGEGDIDLNFINNHDEKLTRFVINKLEIRESLIDKRKFIIVIDIGSGNGSFLDLIPNQFNN